MRPVNLIPPEGRSGRSARMGASPLAILLVAALAAALVAVTALVLTGRQVAAKQAEVAHLVREDRESRERAERLAPFISFAQLKQSREQTIASLATSRFDWERVIRELSFVLPKRVWLVAMTGTVGPDVTVEDGGGSGVRAEIDGPALELEGCARSQRDLARLAASLEDVDGVTRVLVSRGERSGSGGTVTSSSSAGTDSRGCRTRPFISGFSAIVAFDAAPASVDGTAEPSAPPVEPPAGAAPTGAEDGGTAETQAQITKAEGEVADAEQRARQAANAIPAG